MEILMISHVLVLLLGAVLTNHFILSFLGKFKIIDLFTPGLILGIVSCVMVLTFTPHNYFYYYFDHLVMHNNFYTIKEFSMSPFEFSITRHYIFTALTEEICKTSAGFLLYIIMREKSYYKLFTYIVASHIFFAFYENIQYYLSYGEEIIKLRLLYPAILHTSLGIISAFFIILALKQNRFKMILYAFSGLLVVMFLHGSFNYLLQDYIIMSHVVWFFTIFLATFCLFKSKILWLQEE